MRDFFFFFFELWDASKTWFLFLPSLALISCSTLQESKHLLWALAYVIVSYQLEAVMCIIIKIKWKIVELVFSLKTCMWSGCLSVSSHSVTGHLLSFPGEVWESDICCNHKTLFSLGSLLFCSEPRSRRTDILCWVSLGCRMLWFWWGQKDLRLWMILPLTILFRASSFWTSHSGDLSSVLTARRDRFRPRSNFGCV